MSDSTNLVQCPICKEWYCFHCGHTSTIDHNENTQTYDENETK